MEQKLVLDNKLRVILKNLPGTEAVTIMILVGAGSRYEESAQNGISHFLEHMFFKGAKKYKNTKEVSEAIDSVGGEFNAFTGKEYAGYYVKVTKDQLALGIDVLSDMLIHARLDQAEIEKERGVILEEYNMYQDTPMYQIGWSFEQQLFGDQPLGWDQIGTKDVISSLNHEDFKKHMQSLYTPDNIVIALSGNFETKAALDLIQNSFGKMQGAKSKTFKPYTNFDGEKVFVKNKNTEQSHIIVGVKATGMQTPAEWPTKLLATILGGNMSSRMFLKIREQQGLCYYISTSTDTYSDIGSLYTRAGVDIQRTPDAIKAIKNEYLLVSQEGVSEEELTKAKNYLKGKLALKLEESDEYAHMLARQELLRNQTETIESIYSKIDQVSTDDIKKIATEIFANDKFYTTTIGPFPDYEKFVKSLEMN